MAVKIGHASIDENGRAVGGKAGDQTGKEVCFSTWWNDGWTALVRPIKKSVANKIVKACKAGVNNKKIGYDQGTCQRTTLYAEAEKVGFDLSKIEANCEADCSAFVSVCVNAAGVKVSKDIYTGNMVKALEATGAFKVYRGSKYLTSSEYLKAGDILVAEGKHTVIVLEDGEKASSTTTTTTSTNNNSSAAEKFNGSIAGTYKTTNALNLRAGAGTNHKVLHVIPKGDKVVNYGYYSNASGVRWLYVVHKGEVGFVSSNYLRRS